jgi:hypothetical protein
MERIYNINWINIRSQCPNAYTKFVEWFDLVYPGYSAESELGRFKNGRETIINTETFMQFFEHNSIFLSVVPVARSKNKITYDVMEVFEGYPTNKSQLNVDRFNALILAIKFGFSVLEKRIVKGKNRRIKESYSANHDQLIGNYENSSLAPHYNADENVQEQNNTQEEEQPETQQTEQPQDLEEEGELPQAEEQEEEQISEQERQFTEVVNTVSPEWEQFIRQATNNEKPSVNNNKDKE